jgi:Flp pilus assembly protein TadG
MTRFLIRVRDSRGSQIAEMAMVFPLFFVLLVGIFWFGRAFNIYATINRAAREAALAAASRTCATCGNATAGNIRTNVVDPILQAANLDPSAVQNFNLQRNVALNPGSPMVENGAVVSFQYHYDLKLYGPTCCPPGLKTLFNGITMSASAQARQED